MTPHHYNLKEYSYLLGENIIAENDFQKALFISKKTDASVAAVMMDHFQVPKDAIAKSLSDFHNCKFVEYDPKMTLASEVLSGSNLDKSQLLNQCWIPLSWDEHGIVVLVDNPSSFQKTHCIMTALDTDRVIFSVGIKEDIHAFINRAFQEWEVSETYSKAVLGDPSVDVARLVDITIADAYSKGASDIHFECSTVRKDNRIRFRIEGVCQEYAVLPDAVCNEAVNRIKSMANLANERNNLPQQGLIKFIGKDYDVPDFLLKVTTYPTEGKLDDAVLRILASHDPLSLQDLFLSERNLAVLRRTLIKPYGLFLVAGGPGSGKLSILHAILHYINKPGIKVMTAEYPLEIRQQEIRQLEVDHEKGLDFPKAIRCIMASDPDVIMVSSMDQPETAELCLEAALNGFFVLSAVTASTAPDAIEMLLDFGMPPIRLSDALLGVMASKLMRKLCIHCMEQYRLEEGDFRAMVAELRQNWATSANVPYGDDLLLYKRSGCDKCNGVGFNGRVAISELIEINPLLKLLIRKKSFVDAAMIQECAIRQGMIRFEEDGMMKVIQGLTDFEELKRVINQ
jgi:type II secretory ATPase GspE/PulE/Tfp pilus assembly ATPase PilB-like protein